MRLAASLVCASFASFLASTWTSSARADGDPGSIAPPVNVSEAPAPLAPRIAPEPGPRLDTSLPPLPNRPYETEHWYGWEILVTDAASVGGGLTIGPANPGAGIGVFLAGYSLGGPIVHLAHHRPLAALGSLALRVLAPSVGALTGYSIDRLTSGVSDDGSHEASAAGVGLVLGYITAVTIDAAAIARETETVTTESGANPLPTTPPANESSFRWAPTFAPLPGGAVAGIGGRF